MFQMDKKTNDSIDHQLSKTKYNYDNNDSIFFEKTIKYFRKLPNKLILVVRFFFHLNGVRKVAIICQTHCFINYKLQLLLIFFQLGKKFSTKNNNLNKKWILKLPMIIIIINIGNHCIQNESSHTNTHREKFFSKKKNLKFIFFPTFSINSSFLRLIITGSCDTIISLLLLFLLLHP